MRFKKIRNWQKKEELSNSQHIRGWLLQELPVWAQFLAHLLVLVASRPRFCLVIALAVDLTVSLTIGGAESMSAEIVVGFLR